MKYPIKYQTILELSALCDKSFMDRVYSWSIDDLRKLLSWIKRQNRRVIIK